MRILCVRERNPIRVVTLTNHRWLAILLQTSVENFMQIRRNDSIRDYYSGVENNE